MSVACHELVKGCKNGFKPVYTINTWTIKVCILNKGSPEGTHALQKRNGYEMAAILAKCGKYGNDKCPENKI